MIETIPTDEFPAPIATSDDGASTAAKLTRAGWLAKGLLFVVIGGLAAEIARGASEEDADQKGALARIVEQPAGRVLVTVVGVGLVLYGAWQIFSAIHDDDTDLLAVVQRIGRFGLGCSYGLLAITALRIALAGPSDETPGGDQGPTNPDEISARLLELPLGPWLVAVLGIGSLAVGAYHLQKGVRRQFLDDIDTDELGRLAQTTLTTLGVAGFVARSLVLSVVGYLFIDAALDRDPDRAAGLDEALRALQRASFGRPLLIVVAVGLVGAGAFDMLTFRRQRID